MCGICGIAVWKNELDPLVTSDRINLMVDALMHRGPNDNGIINTKSAVFGMTRLAIRGIDNGKQPIVDGETGVMMVCNGEIDNHYMLRAWLKERNREVKQSTDVAVILPLYLELGEDFVQRLQGAFAIAIWDPRSETLLLARDRVGERPLFYSQHGHEVSFASLIAALESPQFGVEKISTESLQGFLQNGYFAAPDTPFENMQKVMPGELVRFSPKGIQHTRYWRWNIVRAEKKTANPDVFDEIFREAVRKQSDVDVDFGLFLSGGLDSSLVAAVAKSVRPEKNLKAFSLRFKEESYDEGSYAQWVADKLGVDFVPVWVEPEDFPSTIKRLIGQVGEPLADPAWVPTALLATRAAQDVSVALVGEGADELFAGYPTYMGAGIAEHYARLPIRLRSLFRRAVEGWPPSDKKVTLAFLLKRFIQGDDLDYLSRHRLWTSSISPELLKRLGVTPLAFEKNRYAATEMLDRLQLHDLENSLAEGLLTKADRGSMKSALELRAPFLDEAVLQFASSLPMSQRIRGVQTKVFLKQYALRYLPKEIAYRKKRGLSVPLSSWLRGPLYQWADTRLRSPSLVELGINIKVSSELLLEHCHCKADHARAIWTLVMLSEWLDWKLNTKAITLEPIKVAG